MSVDIARHGPEALDEVEALALTLKNHHGACTPADPVRGDEEFWRMRRQEYRDWLAEDGAFLLVAREECRPVGYALVRPHGPGPTWVEPERYAVVQDLAVAADAQGGGIGRRLIERAYDESGCATIELAVLHANDSAARFYERLGFAPWAVTLRRTRPA